jgi:hypothetical protein
MEFNSLHEFYLYTKGNIYLIMGGILVAVVLYWSFIMGGEDHEKDPYTEYKEMLKKH